MITVTDAVERLLELLLQPPSQGEAWFAAELAKSLGKSHTFVGTTLNRLEAAGLVEGRMESLDQAGDRAPRRYFTITGKGVRFVVELGERKQEKAMSLLSLASGYRRPRLAGNS